MSVDDDSSDVWQASPARSEITRDEAHIWRASLREAPEVVESLRKTLAIDEQRRAERFQFPQHREEFIVARGVLRSILSRYLNVSPTSIDFAASEHGKPALSAEMGAEWLRFNVSHSAGVALYALTRARSVGVDIERIRPDHPSVEIAERFFSSREVSALKALPANEITNAFFRYWTCKEAYIKGIGEGLSHPLDRFSVSFSDDGAPSVDGEGPRERERFSLTTLHPGKGYVAALAIEGDSMPLRCWQWNSAAMLGMPR